MLFNSIDFLIFFPIVVLIYYVLPRKTRRLWLLTASYYFYLSWNINYLTIILSITLITWISGLVLGNVNNAVLMRKLIIVVCVITNLGVLAFFKYSNFAINNINFILASLGISCKAESISLILPVGISFYTFKALGYTVDVYRNNIKPEKNLFNYALFVSFFPQLVAGPIDRSQNLLKQIQEIPWTIKFNWNTVSEGLLLMIWGLFQKMVIADRVAILVDTVFDSYYMYHSYELVIAAVGYALQIYCDFASYSLIAIGAAKVMGFQIKENFNTPYFARSIKDFWGRWHISLSTWFRDYLYIPLGGNRCGKIKRYRNIMITFLASGLWHGANWTYILWGGVHGVYQIIGAELRPIKDKACEKLHIKKNSESYVLGTIVINFLLVDLAWIIFRSTSLSAAFGYIYRMFTKWNPWAMFNGSLYKLGLNQVELHILVIGVVILFLIDLIQYKKKENLYQFLQRQCLYFQWLVLVFFLIGIIVFGVYGPQFDAKQFIYMQF